ncbi:glycosyltransferase [Acetobacter ghanensis]|uniref:Glycosyltransferase n=2 Tax=Acetobacter ghanensis TaxID=431306 RepID=A0ABX0KQI4_9PROT|nr:glycosyltransferase [Acetobacter ghanensis]
MTMTSNMINTKDTAKYRFGKEVLGPVIAQYLQDLYQSCLYYEREHRAKILFMTRAGLRIHQALGVYLSRIGLSIPEDWEFLWASRMMIAKGIWSRNPRLSCDLFNDAFSYTKLETARQCLLGIFEPTKETHAATFDAADWHWTAERLHLGDMIYNHAPNTKDMTEYLKKQSQLFQEKLEGLLTGRKNAVLVDTGWVGTSQRMLHKAIPEITWWGLYFGLSGSDGDDRSHWPWAKGLVFQADKVDPEKPETSVISHRHLIEDLFETLAPSVESYTRKSDGTISADVEAQNLRALEDDSRSPLYSGVLAYLEAAPANPFAVTMAAKAAWKRLSQFLLMPTRQDAEMLLDQRRSADLGRRFTVSVLIPPDNGETYKERLNKAIWQAGQVALEYDEDIAASVQRKLFDLPYTVPKPKVLPGLYSSPIPTVAVITRTMDRPLFLRRALQSVSCQSFKDYIHVVVCDGGDIEFVKKTIADANIDHSKIKLVDCIENRGMEAASNLGIANSESEFVIIHDDDDTWEPDFLTETVVFLNSKAGQQYGGVITQALHVSESVHPDGIHIHGARLYRDDFFAPTLDDMTKSNTFAPISFLFRRTAYDKVGGFNEKFPVLGDWDFNLKFLSSFDIGYIKKPLANYHHRDVQDVELFGNTVVAGIDKHVEYTPILRNKIARRSRGRNV